MTRKCPDSRCFIHEGEACAEGRVQFKQCPSWLADGLAPDEVSEPSQSNNSMRVNWSGSTLGLTDLANLAPRGRSILVGVLGAHDAGKTTLLMGTYLQLCLGRTLAGARFTGSRSLGAWEALAAWARFDDAARLPRFPQHTPRGISRVPGILHLSLRGSQDEHRDIFLADAPGEWFTRWSIQEDAPDAEGACWIARRADAFLVVADCERLSGPQRGQARNDLRQLVERLGKHVTHRPTTLVWAKNDHKPSDVITKAIRAALQTQIPHATEVSTSTDRPESLPAALETVLQPAWTAPCALRVTESIRQHDPFSAFRGIYAHA